jgi:hypothetical protein
VISEWVDLDQHGAALGVLDHRLAATGRKSTYQIDNGMVMHGQSRPIP